MACVYLKQALANVYSILPDGIIVRILKMVEPLNILVKPIVIKLYKEK